MKYATCIAALILAGCPEDDPIVTLDAAPPVTLDAGADAGVPDAGADLVAPEDAPEPPDEGVPEEELPPPDDVPVECSTNDDCGFILGDLGPCKVPLCEQGHCTGDALKNGTSCDDASACTVGDVCKEGACAGTAVNCDDGNPCTSDACDEALGACSSLPAPGVCDDGNPCTSPDVCEDGACVSTPAQCPPCVTDADCAFQEDGDLCNGTLTCDGGKCVTQPGTAISCASVLVGQCQAATCAPATGTCAVEPKADGTPCTPSSPCLEAGYCAGGTCQGKPVTCDDGNPCTVDVCDSAKGCVAKPLTGGLCDDGNNCTTGDVCSFGECLGQPLVDCNDGNACTDDTCDPSTLECLHPFNAGGCDDANFCTAGDHCEDGACVAGGALFCDDGNACTSDACVPLSGCVHTKIVCDDQSTCTVDTCDPAQGCLYTLPGKACTANADCFDGLLCTQDACTFCGYCTYKAVVCDDDNICTGDKCTEGVGCTHPPANGGACDDGQICTVGEACQAGKCQGGEVVCPCFGDPDGTACDDGDPCTKGDACKGSKCYSGVNTCGLGTKANPAQSCKDIQTFLAGAADGAYWLKPAGAANAFQVFCDLKTLGGGWMRVAWVKAEVALCSYADPVGTEADLLAGGAKTAVMALAQAKLLPFTGKDVLVVLAAGTFVFHSDAAGWTWSAIADGTINAETMPTYGVTGSLKGGAFEALKAPPSTAGKGVTLLGGIVSSTGKAAAYLGIGSYHSLAFKQDAKCASSSTGHFGFYSGTVSPPAKWNTPGAVYIR